MSPQDVVAVAESPQGGSARIAFPSAVLLVILVAFELGLWLVWIPARRADAAAAVLHELAVHAEPQALAVDSWLDGGIGDATIVAAFPSVRAIVGRATQGDRHLDSILQSFAAIRHLEVILVLDARGRVVARSSPLTGWDDAARAQARRTLESRRAAADFQLDRTGISGVVFAAPVYLPGRDDRPAGVVASIGDPRLWLYPFLAFRPTDRSTAEALLLRRESDSLRYLTPLRHHSAPPLSLMRAADEPGFAGAAAVGTPASSGPYTDYRGVAVLAATRRLQLMPWGLVVKVDRADALGPVQRRLRQMGFTASIAAVSLAVAVLVLFWRQRAWLLAREARAFAAERAQRHAEQQLTGIRAILAAALEQAAEIVVLTDTKGTIQHVNPAFERVTGYTSAEAVGRNPSMLKSGLQGDEVYQRMWTTLGAGEVFVGEVVNRRKNGELYTAVLRISPVRDAAGRLTNYLGLQRDVTAERLQEKQLRQAQKMEVVGQLAGGIAHDFNNVLAAVTVFAELIDDQLPAGSPIKDDVAQVQAAAQQATRLTRQLLSFSRHKVVRPEIVDLNQAVRGAAGILDRLIGERIELVTDLAPDVGTVFADAGHVEQILMNLSVNARDAMPGGGALTIATGFRELDEAAARRANLVPGRYVSLAVTDTGTGMSPEVMARIFEPFYTTKGAKGTGLGLATVQGIVELSGGAISATTAPGRGSTFTVLLPEVRGEPSAVSPAVPSVAGGTETIVIAEDDAGLRHATTVALRRHGFTVMAARTGEEALQLAARHAGDIHLLLSDLIMPGMDGRELSTKLQALRPGIRVLLMSGYQGEASARRRPILPETPFLEKPFLSTTLVRMVREVLDAPR